MKKHQRLPSFIPRFLEKRIRVELFGIERFVRQASSQIPARARLLDAGSGEGRYRAEFPHTRYVGVDLAVGDDTWNYSQLDTIATLTMLPFDEQAFDAVLCTQVLEHVREPLAVLSELQRVLKPGGKLYLTAPQSWHQHQKPHDYFRYTSFGLRYLLEKSGLRVHSMEPLGGYFWFLSFQLQNINYWVFSSRRNRYHWLTWPLRACLGLIFQLLLPLVLFYLDGLDPVKDETFGYACVAIKPPGSATDPDISGVN